MPVRGDFTLIHFGEHLGSNESNMVAPGAAFVGNQSSIKTFNVDNRPTGEAYLMIQTLKVGAFSHKIFVNGTALTGYNIPQHDGWSIWMVAVQENLLKHGANTLQIIRDLSSDDNFVVGYVVVHWREITDSIEA